MPANFDGGVFFELLPLHHGEGEGADIAGQLGGSGPDWALLPFIKMDIYHFTKKNQDNISTHY